MKISTDVQQAWISEGRVDAAHAHIENAPEATAMCAQSWRIDDFINGLEQSVLKMPEVREGKVSALRKEIGARHYRTDASRIAASICRDAGTLLDK